MFFGYAFYGLFTLFAFIFIRIQCLREGHTTTTSDDKDETSVEYTTRRMTTTTLKMDDLRNFDMTYYCKFQATTRICVDQRPSYKYFFDIKLRECVQFEYGYCNHSYNMFDGRHVCLDSCRDEVSTKVSEDVTFNVFCRYQPDFGECNSYYPMFYYDVSDGKCKGFAYSGCGGNKNRFPSAIECLDVCGLLYINQY